MHLFDLLIHLFIKERALFPNQVIEFLMNVPYSPKPLHIDPQVLHLRRIAPVVVQIETALERRDRVH